MRKDVIMELFLTNLNFLNAVNGGIFSGMADRDLIFTFAAICGGMILIAIILLIRILGMFSKSHGVSSAAPVGIQNKNDADEEIVAVISAAIAAFSQQEGKNYTIKSIKPANEKNYRSSWGSAAAYENTRTF